MGLEEGLRILEKVKAELDLPVVTDVHETTQCPAVGQVVDLIQIPAFLARQTDLLVAAAKTGKAVNVKKGQFMAPDDMRNVAAKLAEAGNEKILFCERGTSFGYHTLVVDFTGLIEMRKIGFPIVFDATHSVQKPGGNGTSSGGNREYAAPLMNAALAVGVDAIFAEVHPDPSRAISDAENQIPLAEIREKRSKKLHDTFVPQFFIFPRFASYFRHKGIDEFIIEEFSCFVEQLAIFGESVKQVFDARLPFFERFALFAFNFRLKGRGKLIVEGFSRVVERFAVIGVEPVVICPERYAACFDIQLVLRLHALVGGR